VALAPRRTPSSLAEPDIVELLLGRGAVVDGTDNTEKTALAFVADMDWWWYAKADATLLDRWLRCLRVLVAHGADPNQVDKWGATPVEHASRHRSLAVLATLVELGAEVTSSRGVLHALLAVPGGRRTQPAYEVVACLRLLLERGADPNAVGADGRTALEVAARDPKMPAKVAGILRDHGAR